MGFSLYSLRIIVWVMVWPLDKLATSNELDELRRFVLSLEEEIDGHDSLIEDLEAVIEELEEGQKDNTQDISDLESEAKRLDKVIEEIREEALKDKEIELQPMEQEIFKVLMKADKPLKYKEIGKRMEKERTPDQVRPKLISLKEKVTILEDKDGRAKVFSIPSKTKKDYIEKGELTEIEEKL